MYRGKRLYDLTISLLLLPIAVPLTLAGAVTLYLFSGKSPIFIQQRPGFKEIPFALYKLRTLYPREKVAVNRLGKFFRAYSIDELPQILNVIMGEMSVVGPRPLLSEYLPLYNKRQRRRHLTRPGITGWAQIHGRNNLGWPSRFELDLWYLEHQNLVLDIKITIRSLWKVFQTYDVKPEGLKESEKFKGNLKD